jgi:hypothetical protein
MFISVFKLFCLCFMNEGADSTYVSTHGSIRSVSFYSSYLFAVIFSKRRPE